MALAGNVVLVTGATRGIGKGIAIEYARAGATVYITGRTLKRKPGTTGSLEDTANEISQVGGKCVPVQCDHTDAEAVKRLFERINSENSGRLDVLVNNAYAAVQALLSTGKKRFDQCPVDLWDTVNNVGLRNHYICSWHAAQLMVPRKNGLIVNISSPGGLFHFFAPAYGIGKAGCDRMAHDLGGELRRQGVTFISCWPGAVATEHVQENILTSGTENADMNKVQKMFEGAESPAFVGRVLVKYTLDPKRHGVTSKTLMTGDMAAHYGLKYDDGTTPSSTRSVGKLLQSTRLEFLAPYVPTWVKLPLWMVWLGANRLAKL